MRQIINLIGIILTPNTLHINFLYLSGSQIPCFETRSDGRDNIVGALILGKLLNKIHL